jgi:hypothetical protein
MWERSRASSAKDLVDADLLESDDRVNSGKQAPRPHRSSAVGTGPHSSKYSSARRRAAPICGADLKASYFAK